jgi:hypothetical protein
MLPSALDLLVELVARELLPDASQFMRLFLKYFFNNDLRDDIPLTYGTDILKRQRPLVNSRTFHGRSSDLFGRFNLTAFPRVAENNFSYAAMWFRRGIASPARCLRIERASTARASAIPSAVRSHSSRSRLSWSAMDSGKGAPVCGASG